MPGPPRALLAVVAHGERICLYAAGRAEVLSPADAAGRIDLAAERLVVWSAARDLTAVVAAGARPARVLDLAEAHRIVRGGWRADPGRVWAAATGLDRGGVPEGPGDDLFAALVTGPGEEDLLTPEGYLRPDAVAGRWTVTDDRLVAWARAALECAGRLGPQLDGLGARAASLAASESAAAVLCLELERDGLPIDRAGAGELIALAAGPRPRDEAHARAIRAERDARVLAVAPGHDHTDLRNPASVRALLAAVGIDVPTTRKWVLENHRHVHPVIPALLDWRRDERIATTYGYGWLDAHVGPDDRLRGTWTACDGAAGRMTAQNGLHNLPVPMRAAVAAAPGWRFVRADLGQIEPRVLAVVSGDPALAEATASPDLYAPVAERLGVERSVAKVAVLAAMYGQRSGTAGRALTGLQRAYPVAMGFLDAAYAAGVSGADLRTFGGRRLRTRGIRDEGSRGRYARNALIQGAAAELFKCWAATVRAALVDAPARIALCLHDELLVHTPAGDAAAVSGVVESALADAARRWSGGAPVRFVADTTVITRWSEAK
ncbi:MAG: DNA polymerase [Tetrasphaera sp.]